VNRLSPKQIVAFNLRRARGLRGWTQETAAERLEPLLGERWSRAVYSAAERSITGERIRQFDADEIAAFAVAFELPVAFFFMPPRDTELGVADDTEELASDELVPEGARADVEKRVEALLGELERHRREEYGITTVEESVDREEES
jgi:transcriptional regulator with XRE-family HTH domain